MKYIELRGDDLLTAVVKGTEANAHLVAGNAFAWGIEHAMEQYNLSEDLVFSAIKFYVNNRDIIEKRYAEIEANTPSREETFSRIKAKAEAWRKQQMAQTEDQP